MLQLILTDLNGNVHGEIRNASDRKIVLPHLRIPTCSFKLPLWHSLAPTIMDTECLVKAYRYDPVTSTRTLAFHGPIVSPEENGEGNQQTVNVTAAGPYWRMLRRYIGHQKAGIAYPSQDLGLTAHNILDTLNGENYTGIAKGTRTASVTGVYGPVWLKSGAEAISELEGGLNSFELEIVPSEPGTTGVGGWPTIGTMNIAPLIGTTKPDAIFEYGTTRANVASYSRKVDREGMANRTTISVQGWPDAAEGARDLIIREDSASITARGLYEAIVPDGGVIDDGLRTSIADFHLLIRKAPRQQVTFKPARNARPAPLVDYKVGDTVRARAVVRGNVRFDALFRIWGITFEMDPNGNENVELELVMP